eukprot:g6943.t1
MHETLAAIARETVLFMEQSVADSNALGRRLVSARERTEHFKQEDTVVLEPPMEHFHTTLEVTREKTLAASKRLIAEGYENPCALNFASASEPGGGFLRGAIAQEEYLCRISGLYWCIMDQEMYHRNYEVLGNRGLYLHDLQYSPGVPVFRDSDTYEYLNEEDVFEVAFVTCPSPNVGAIHPGTVSNETLTDTMRERIRRILTVAANKGHSALVLGAFGCGAFLNDPVMVANQFLTLLSGYFRGVFKKIIFGVYEREDGPSITAFRQIIGESKHISPSEESVEASTIPMTIDDNKEEADLSSAPDNDAD